MKTRLHLSLFKPQPMLLSLAITVSFALCAQTNSILVSGSALNQNGTVVMPFTLTDFTAKYNKPNVSLFWTTVQEKNFSHFVLEQSTDGTTYSDNAVIFGAGESDTRVDYKYNDKNLAGRSGLVYYRLRSVDKDGRIAYSMVRIIRLGEEKPGMVLTTYPNPVISDVRITIPAAWQTKPVKVEFYNNYGNKVKEITILRASQTEILSTAGLNKGIYVINAKCANESAQQRILKD